VCISVAVQLVNLIGFNKLGTDVIALEYIPNFVVFDPLPLIDGGYILIMTTMALFPVTFLFILLGCTVYTV
jgi:hypothetical protein